MSVGDFAGQKCFGLLFTEQTTERFSAERLLHIRAGRKKEGKEEGKQEKQGKTRIRGSVLSCRSASPRSAALALSCPLLSPLPLQLSELRRCACRACQQGQAVSEDLLLPQHVGEPTESPYRKTSRAVPAFAGIALIPAKTRLKKTCP